MMLASPVGIEAVRAVVARLANYVTAIAAGVAVLFVAINGVRLTISDGSPIRRQEAKSGLVSALTGLAVALSANVIVQLVVAALR